MKTEQHIFLFAALLIALVVAGCGPIASTLVPAATPTIRQARLQATPRQPTGTLAPSAASATITVGAPTRISPTATRLAATPSLESREALYYFTQGKNFGRGPVDYGKSIELYTQAIQLKPDYMEAYLQRGLAHCLVHETEPALVDWEKVLSLPATNSNEVSMKAEAANFLAAFSIGC